MCGGVVSRDFQAQPAKDGDGELMEKLQSGHFTSVKVVVVFSL